MSAHNLVLNSGYELIGKDGHIIKSNFTNGEPVSEGEWSIESGDRKISGPTRSLRSGFLEHQFTVMTSNTYTGRMANYKSTSWETTGMIRVNHYTGYSSFLTTDETVTICEEIPHLTEDADHNPVIQLTLSRGGTMKDSGKSIGIVALGNGSWYGDQTKEVISPAFAVNALDQFKITYTLRFPTSSTASLTQNFFYNWIGTAIGNVNFTNLQGEPVANNTYPHTDTNASLSAGVNCITAAAGAVDKGLVIGTSDEAVSWTDYALKAPLGADIMYPSATAKTDCVGYSGGELNGYTKCARTFTNVGTAAVTIREAGIVSKITQTPNTNPNASPQPGVMQPGSFLMVRWLLPEPITVQPEEAIRVYWQPTIVA